MLIRDLLRTAQNGVTANIGRSLLTMLGIIIGVGSVVLMTSLGGGVQLLVLNQVSTLGARSMIVLPGNDDTGGNPALAQIDSLKLEDVEAIERLSTVRSVAPAIFITGKIEAGREESQPQIIGTTVNFFRNQNLPVGRGRLLDASDEAGAAPVVVLGPDTAEDLFAQGDPLGRRIQILGRPFTVVGVLQSVGTQFFQNADERAYVPFSTARVLTGQKYANYVTLQAADSVDLAEADIESLLRARHRIVNPEADKEKDDFHIHSAAQATSILGTVTLALTLFLAAIAGISLVVGGIGIMNIMLVVVTERTREIGLRKAIGARSRDILLQFLVESTLLTAIGGVIGVVGGLGVAWVASLVVRRFLPAFAFSVSPSAILLALLVAAGTGLVFGVYPARRAARLHPIEALRYE